MMAASDDSSAELPPLSSFMESTVVKLPVAPLPEFCGPGLEVRRDKAKSNRFAHFLVLRPRARGFHTHRVA
jgi:hypothetical protein